MTGTRRFAEIALLCAVAMLALMLGHYQREASLLRLEGDDLYSPGAVIASIAPSRAIDIVKRLGGENRAFVYVRSEPTVRVMTAGDAGSVALPISSGRQFSSLDRTGALVGASFASQGTSATQIRIDGVVIPVVGRLGLAPESLLKSRAVVVDDDLFRSRGGDEVVFDGPEAPDAVRRDLGSSALRPVTKGMSVRTDADLITPLLVRLGGGVSLLAGVALGALAGVRRLRPAGLLFLEGWTRSRIFLWVLGAAALNSVAALACSVLAARALAVDHVLGILLLGALGYCLVAVFVFALQFSRRSAPWSS